MLSSNPPLFLTGDYLSAPSFSGNVTAAYSVAAAIQSIMAPLPPPKLLNADQRSVLVIGSGVTGCVLVEKLRKKHPQLSIHVWEAAQGTGGRVARKQLELGNANSPILDLGAQVFSGIQEDEAWHHEIEQFVNRGLMHRAHGLAPTEERGQEKHIAHYWARDGATSILREYLKGAKVNEMHFNRRVTSIDRSPGCGRWRVGYSQGRVSDPHATHKVADRGTEMFHSVVVATNAWDAMHIDGVAPLMSQELKHAVQAVEYDSRFAVGLCFIPKFKKHIEAIFNQESEMVPQDNVLHLVAYQGAKREAEYPAVVVHTTTNFAAEVMSGTRREPEEQEAEILNRILQQLGSFWRVDPGELLQGLLASKMIAWRQCQVKKAAPPYMSEDGVGCAVVSREPPLMLCGDYLSGAGMSMMAMRAGMAGAAKLNRVLKEPSSNDQGGPTVLVLGAGIFGCATAAKIRERNPHAKIKVWDASKGTGGKIARCVFSTLTGTTAIADMGTQVLNCNMSDPLSVREVEKLTKNGILHRAHALAKTEERPSRDSSNDVSGYWASKGLTAVCRHYLKEAQLDELCLGKRATSVMPIGQNRWRVCADIGEVTDPYAEHKVTDTVEETFDVVVTAMPSYELMKLGGLQAFLPDNLQRAVSDLRYDRRYAVGLCFLQAFKLEIERWMNHHAEVTIDDGVIHLVANQGAKRVEDCCVLVCHTARQYQVNSTNKDYRSEVMVAVLNSLANSMQIPVARLRQLLHSSKVIDWRQCQCQEQVPGYQGCALVSTKPRLIMVGDYFTSFPGCAISGVVHSAQAAAQALTQESVIEVGSIPRPLGLGASASSHKKVLIVGAGPTGCMLASQLKRRYPDLRVSIWECARGVGGRMSSKRIDIGNGKEVVVDMGAQCLSCTMQEEIMSEIEYLQNLRLVTKCSGMAVSEERGADGGMNMVHYWAKDGTSSIYRKYLEEADVEELLFNTRVSNLEKTGHKWLVTAMRGDVGDPHAPHHVRSQMQHSFDAVVLALPAHDVMRIGGVAEVVQPDVQQSLQTAQSDQRWSIAVVLAAWLKQPIENTFGGSAERVLDNNMIHLIAYQNAKREQPYPALVIHTTRMFAENRGHTKESVWSAVKQQLTQIFNVDNADLEMGVMAIKMINWWECQTVVPGSRRSCVACTQPPLLLAGDFLTSASFSGCVEAASMAAQAVGHEVGIRNNRPPGWALPPAVAGGRKYSKGHVDIGVSRPTVHHHHHGPSIHQNPLLQQSVPSQQQNLNIMAGFQQQPQQSLPINPIASAPSPRSPPESGNLSLLSGFAGHANQFGGQQQGLQPGNQGGSNQQYFQQQQSNGSNQMQVPQSMPQLPMQQAMSQAMQQQQQQQQMYQQPGTTGNLMPRRTIGPLGGLSSGMQQGPGQYQQAPMTSISTGALSPRMAGMGAGAPSLSPRRSLLQTIGNQNQYAEPRVESQGMLSGMNQQFPQMASGKGEVHDIWSGTNPSQMGGGNQYGTPGGQQTANAFKPLNSISPRKSIGESMTPRKSILGAMDPMSQYGGMQQQQQQQVGFGNSQFA
jgi:predicted NAD/FAD-dependent oxidoreductase